MATHAPFAWSLLFATLLLVGVIPANAATLPVVEMNRVLGEKGDYLRKDVVRYSWLRTDLKVLVDHVEIEPALALESWAAFMPTGDGNAIAIGELVVRRPETDRVIETLDTSPLTITAVCDHLVGESPRLTYVGFLGRGNPLVLAHALRKALDATATPLKSTPPVIPAMPARWVDEIRMMLGYPGLYQNGVLSIVVARSNEVRMDGYMLPPPMGLSTRLNFQAVKQSKIAVAGSFVLVANEVSRVLSSLSGSNIEVTALGGHVLQESPRLFYLRFFAVGTPGRLARALRAALNRTGTGKEP